MTSSRSNDQAWYRLLMDQSSAPPNPTQPHRQQQHYELPVDPLHHPMNNHKVAAAGERPFLRDQVSR